MPEFDIPFRVIKNKRSKYIRLVVSENGDLVVRTPPAVTKKQILHTLNRHKAWIKKTTEKMQIHAINNPPPAYISGEKFPLFGRKLTIHIQEGTRDIASESDNEICVTLKKGNMSQDDRSRQLLEKFFRDKAKEILRQRVPHFQKLMNIHINNIRIKNVRSLWGSSSSRKNLNFNFRIAFCPPPVIDYLIIHELAHQVHPNHSREFHEYVGRFQKDHIRMRKWLRDNEQELFRFFRND